MTTTQLRARVRAGDPAPTTAPYTEAHIVSFTAQVTSRIEPQTVRRRRGHRRLVVAMGLAAAIALVPVLKFGLQAPVSTAAADVLNEAASNVMADPVTHPGQYWKIMTRSVEQDGNTEDRLTYMPVTGEGYYWWESRANGLSDVYRSKLPVGDQGAWQMPSTEFLASLPTDVDALRDRLYADTAGHGSTVDGEAFVYIRDLLITGLVTPELQSRLLRVAATIPGVEITSESVTLDGRTGVGLSCVEVTGGERLIEMVIDVTTGQMLGERHLWNGEVTYTASRTRELVNEVPADVITKARK